MYRSTKGASKARRDQINAEIRNLKDLLPISDADKARLSYLHIMSLASMYTRKSVFFSQESGSAGSLEESARFMSFDELSELVQELPGFLLLLTGEGKLLYLSDSVSEHLGHSMVDLVAQGDSVYDIIDPTDHFIMRTNLAPPTSPDTDRLFRCRFNTSKSVRRQSAGNKLVLIRARCLSPPSSSTTPSSYWTSNPVWMCFCSPLEAVPTRSGPGGDQVPALIPPAAVNNFFLATFQSQHSRDMRLQNAQDSVSVYLGLDVSALRSRSWYSLLHPQDLSHASAQHCSLLREGGEGRSEMVVRVESADQSWVWLYMVLQLEAGDSPISSNNYILSEAEAWSVRQQLSTEQTQLTLVLSTSTSRQDSLSLSSPDQVFTPSSSGLSAQSFDFSMTVSSVGSSDETGGATTEPMQVEGDPRSSISSIEEESFFQQQQMPAPVQSPSAASSPTPVTVATVADLDFLTQNILLPPSFQLEPPLPALPLPLPPTPTSQEQQTKEFVCTPPYTPQLGGGSFLFGEPLFSFDPTGTTTPPPSTTTATATTSIATSLSPSAPPAPPTTASSPAPPSSLCLTGPSTNLFFPADPCSGSLYEKLPPTPDSPGDGDCTVMTLPEVRGPLYVDVPLGPLHYPLEGLLTPEASPGKQPCLSFFSLEREREKERAEISLLAQHISSLAEGFYLDPLLSKLSPPSMSPSSSPPSPSLSPSLDTAGVDSSHMLGEFYPVKAWRGLDFPIFHDDESLFEESILEALLQDFSTPPPLSPSLPPPSPPNPVCWHSPSHFEGVSHFCSVQSAHCNPTAGSGATLAGESGAMAEVEGLAEEPMEIEVASSPLSSCSSIPASPPLRLTASPTSAPFTPVDPSTPAVPCAQSLLEELAALEPMFGAGASIAPGLGQQPELYQLQCHQPPQCFHKDGSGSVPPF
ncbi:neuronal PAS domain-containing protein 4A-like [Salvelinus fontinalis]|uniref:neuronal PAS domain-containing protein 4A-like n=1 Tax=Salvelinus fontinalis TaxID=8038 RepID=UPI002485EAFF|nr:neuronal PAS domain-containing protein 4A-like [Salvelinus fontinalis]